MVGVGRADVAVARAVVDAVGMDEIAAEAGIAEDAVKLALAEGFSLPGALSRLPGAPPNLPELREEDYLGENDLFIDRVLSAAQKTDRSMK